MNGPPWVERGDCFAVQSGGPVGVGINFFQLLQSHDNEATFSHTGIITNAAGDTIEAKRKIIAQNLFTAYHGRRVLIVRPDAPAVVKDAAIKRVSSQHLGQTYPFWRIPLHMIPVLAKYASAGGRFVVCSELDAKYLWYAGARHAQYIGATPDMLADEWRNYRNYSIIYDSILLNRMGREDR